MIAFWIHIQYEIGQRGSWTDGSGGLFQHCDAADKRNNGWGRRLELGKSFTSVPAVSVRYRGNFNDAIT